MAGAVDPRTTIVDALLVGRASREPVGGQTIVEAHGFGVFITPLQNRHFKVITNVAGSITLDADDGGNARGNVNLLAGTDVVQRFGLNPFTPGTSRWNVFNGEISAYMLECNGSGTLEFKEHVDYVETGDELWDLLSDSVSRRIYLRTGVMYDLPAGAGTRVIDARKTVVGASASDAAVAPVIRLNGNDLLNLTERCNFEGIKFTENWVGPTYPAQLINMTGDGTHGGFVECDFVVSNSPTDAMINLWGGEISAQFHFERCTFEAPTTTGLECIVSGGSQSSHLRDCRFTGGDTAVSFTGSTHRNLLIEGNVFNSAAGSGVALKLEGVADKITVRDNTITKAADASPSPALWLDMSGAIHVENNHIATEHASAATWGANYLVLIEDGDVKLIGNNIVGQQMTNVSSGLVGVMPSIDSLLCRGNEFSIGTNLTQGVVIDTEGVTGKPSYVQLNDNLFNGDITVAGGACISFIDSTAGANAWPTLGTIANNIFPTHAGFDLVHAVGGSPPSGQEVTGYTVTGNVMHGEINIDQGTFDTSILRHNINTHTVFSVDPPVPARDNLVGDNIPVTVPG